MASDSTWRPFWARLDDGFTEDCAFLQCCQQDRVLAGVKLIAEPWDCGPGGYQVGGFPPGWAEWNDRFRDTVRSFWKGDESKAPELATRITASADLFNHRGRRPWSCVNFITAHDGFTLNDLVSYNDKHNDANGEDGRDGNSNNHSWNCGAEGDTDNADIVALRERQKRNMLATLLLAQGTPMLLAGDEFGNSQQGNNNAYCQDNEISWLNWEQIDADSESLRRFVQRLTSLRRQYPVLRRNRFLNADWNEALQSKDVTWLSPSGEEMNSELWSEAHAHCFGMLLDGRSATSAILRKATDSTLLLVFNAYHDVVEFKLPATDVGQQWQCLVDTNVPEADSPPTFAEGDVFVVTGRSFVMFGPV